MVILIPILVSIQVVSTQHAITRWVRYQPRGHATSFFLFSHNTGNPPSPGHTTSGGVNWIGEIVQTAPACFLEWNFAYSGATVNNSIVAPYTKGIPDMITQVNTFQSGVGAHVPQYPWTADNAAAAVWFGVSQRGRIVY